MAKNPPRRGQTPTCSICGRPEEMVKYLVPGPVGNLCNECADAVHYAVKNAEEAEKKEARFSLPDLEDLPKPKEIVSFLDQYVIGQDEAKKSIAVAVYNHYKRLYSKGLSKTGTVEVELNNPEIEDVELDKSNMIMIGPTGTGKTLLAKSVARLLKVPFTIVDATVFTQAGYVGEDVESILSRLLQVADYDVEAAERGIVFIDEVDKLSRKADNPSITRDVGGEGVQQSLLKLLEGTDVNVPPQGGRKHPEQKMILVNTENILFICGGAFDGIERKVAQRLNTRMVGFNSVSRGHKKEEGDDLLKYATPADLRAYGLIPELIGRLPVLTYLTPLDAPSLKRILTEPKNAISKQYKKLLGMDGVELKIDPGVYDFVVEKAIEFRVGARGLRSIFESIMTDAMFEAPSSDKKNLRVTRKYAEAHFRATALQLG